MYRELPEPFELLTTFSDTALEIERFFQASKRQVPPSVQNRSILQLIFQVFTCRVGDSSMTAHRPQALVSRACSAFFQLRPFYSGVCPEKHTSASEMISLVRERSTTHDADHEARPVRGHPGRRRRSVTLVVRTPAGLSSKLLSPRHGARLEPAGSSIPV